MTDPSTHPPTEAVGEVRRRVEEDWTTNVELENAVAEVKRAQGVETMQAYQLAKLLPEHLRQPFWEDAVKYYLADALALTEAVERDGCWVPLAEATKLRSDLAAMTSDRDWLRGEFEKATAGEHYWNFGCHKAERERDEAITERDALLPVAEAAVAWRANPGDPEVLALLVAVDEWQSTQPKETDHGQV